MYEKFDRALARGLSSEHTAFGIEEKGLALATARRSAAENRVNALNEASLGNVRFAAIHEAASTRFHEDAEAMARGEQPVHHAIGFYLTMAMTYRSQDKTAAVATGTSVLQFRQARGRHRAA